MSDESRFEPDDNGGEDHHCPVVGRPFLIASGQSAPGCPGLQPPQDAVDDRAVIPPLSTPSPTTARRQRRDDAPRLLGQFAASHQLLLRSLFVPNEDTTSPFKSSDKAQCRR